MLHELEGPDGELPNWDILYLSRGSSEDSSARPIMTGDIFEYVTVRTVNGEEKVKTVMVLQHPCALRSDGVELSESVLVVLVRQHKIIEPADWKKYWKLMPLPDLMPSVDSGKRNQAALFDDTFHVHRDELRSRVACLSLRGVNLLIQRWVHHCSRVVVKTDDIDQETSGAYEEVDVVEEWCSEAMLNNVPRNDALRDVDEWLKGAFGSQSRREALVTPQYRSQIRRAATAAVKESFSGYSASH